MKKNHKEYIAQEKQLIIFNPIIAAIFIVLIFSSNLVILGSSGSNFISTMEWIGWSIVISLIIYTAIRAFYQSSIAIPTLVLFALLYFLLVIISAYMANNFDFNAMWEWYGFLLGVLFLWTISQFSFSQKQLTTIVVFIISTAFIHSILAILQANQTQIYWDNVFYTLLPAYPVSSFYQVNSIGSYIATTMLLTTWIKIDNKRNLMTYILLAIMLIMLFTMAYVINYTGSRTALLGLVIGGILALIGRIIYSKNNKNKNNSLTFLVPFWMWIVAAFLGYMLSYYINGHSIADKLLSLASLEQGTHRWSFYTASWQLFLDKPLFGHGLGAFTQIFQPAYFEVMSAIGRANEVISSTTNHPHNELFYRLSESGLVGVTGMVAIVIFVARALWKQQAMGFIYAAILIPLALHTQTEYPFKQNAYSWLLFIFILYLATRSFNYKAKTAKILTKKSVRIISTISLLLLLFFSYCYIYDKTEKANIFTHLINNKNTKISKEMSLRISADNHFGRVFKMHQLIKNSGAINSMPNNELKELLSTTEKLYKYMPNAPYFNIKILILTKLEEFDKAYKVLQEAQKLYPGYTKSQTVGILLLERATVVAISNPKKLKDRNIWMKRFYEWATHQPKDKLSALQYELVFHILTLSNQPKAANEWIKIAKGFYPKQFDKF